MTRPFTHPPAPKSPRALTPAGSTKATIAHERNGLSACRDELRSPFEPFNIDLMIEDERTPAQRILDGLSKILLAILIACVCRLIWANLPA